MQVPPDPEHDIETHSGDGGGGGGEAPPSNEFRSRLGDPVPMPESLFVNAALTMGLRRNASTAASESVAAKPRRALR